MSFGVERRSFVAHMALIFLAPIEAIRAIWKAATTPQPQPSTTPDLVETPRFRWRYCPDQCVRVEDDKVLGVERDKEIILLEFFGMPYKPGVAFYAGCTFYGVRTIAIHREDRVHRSDASPVSRLRQDLEYAVYGFDLSEVEQAALKELIELVEPDWTPQDCPTPTSPKPLLQFVVEWSGGADGHGVQGLS